MYKDDQKHTQLSLIKKINSKVAQKNKQATARERFLSLHKY
jgi:hypothetical protein